MSGLSLVMPMAGAGSRFQREGWTVPKPMIPLGGRPFLQWAIDSVARAAPVRELVAVVLKAHVDDFAIDRAVLAAWPTARLVVLEHPTSGAAETAAAGVAAVEADGPVAVNDCDHAFASPGLAAFVRELGPRFDAGLVGFESESPGYAYADVDAAGRVRAVVEKRPISRDAVAGCYLFRDRGAFLAAYEGYRDACPYEELFVSGLYSRMIAAGSRVGYRRLARHLSFGTPEEMARVTPAALAALHSSEVTA